MGGVLFTGGFCGDHNALHSLTSACTPGHLIESLLVYTRPAASGPYLLASALARVWNHRGKAAEGVLSLRGFKS